MNRTAIGVWLLVALIGIALYLLPEAMKQLFFIKEQFVGSMKSEKEAWKFAATEAYVDVPKEAAKPVTDKATPDYLQNIPANFDVGAAGNAVTESQPASIDGGESNNTPMMKQGQQAQRTVKAPAAQQSVEGFEGSPSPSPSPSPAPVTASTTVQPPAPSPAPVNTPSKPVCGYEYNADPKGNPVYTCDGKITTPPMGQAPPKPKWLNAAATRDGIDAEEATILNWWLSNDDRSLPGWVQQLANAETVTASEKKAFAAWAAENTKASNANVIKATTGYSNTSSGSSSASGTKCKPKPKCKPKSGAGSTGSTGTETNTATCKGPIDMGNYIRKDSIPCWACTL
jgi:hypothetical protein